MKKKFIALSFLAAFAVTLTGGLMPQKAHADLSGRWVNIAVLEVDGKRYQEDKIDNNWHFYLVDDPDGCRDEIDDLDFNPDAQNEGPYALPKDDKVTLTRKVKSPSGCTAEGTEVVNLSGNDAARYSFNWIDKGAIEIPGQGTRFKKDDGLGGAFVRSGDNECKDTLEAPEGSSTAALIVRVTRKAGSWNDMKRRNELRGVYQGHTWVDQIDYHKEEGGNCIISDVITGLPLGLVAENSGKEAGTGTGSDGGSDDDSAEAEPSCESEGGEMSWLLCPVLRLASNAIGALDEEINNLLIVPDSYYNNDKMHETWGQLRNLALLILVPIVLVMVIGTALGFELVSAYTVKKALPRLFIAVIFITLSWPITQFFIGFINTVGQGIAGVLGSAFGTPIDEITLASLFDPGGSGTQDFGIALVGIFATGVALSVLSIGIILSYAFMALLGLFIGFVLLAMRQFLVVALMLFAPLAILAWIFPGNDKLWKLWRESFTKLLLLYPLVMILISAGRIFAKVVQDVGTGGGDAALQGFAAIFIKLLAYVGPYFFIPAAFKFAGGIFANLAGMANDKSRGLLDRQRKYRAAKMGENWNKTKNYQRYSDKRALGRGLNTILGAGASPKDLARGRAGIAAGMRTGRMNQGADAYKNDPTMAAHANDENFNMAVMSESLAKQNLADTENKYNKARNDLATANASGDTAGAQKAQADMNKYLAQMDAQRNGIENAKRVKNRNSSAVRLAALNQLAASGYGFSQGKQGYKELSDAVDEITGGDQAARVEAMNTAQFNLKNAGRYDLAGINNGAGYDAAAGVGKVDPYTMATRAKPETIQAKGELMRESIARAEAAANAGDMDTYHREMEQAEIHHQELKTGWDGATGKNKEVFQEELATVEPPEPGRPPRQEFVALSRWAGTTTGRSSQRRVTYDASNPPPRKDLYNPNGWTDDEMARGWRMEQQAETRADVARTKARGTRRPNPADLDES